MRVFVLATFGVFALSSGVAAAPPDVVVSIKPLHSLVAGVMAGVAEPELLVKNAVSPHEYSLRPGDAKILANADLIFSVGPKFETFLAKPLATLASKGAHVAATDMPGVTSLKARAGGLWEAHAHVSASADHDHDHDHDHDNAHVSFNDGHLWLSPDNAKAIMSSVAKSLSTLDGENAARYQGNAELLSARIDELDRELMDLLRPHQEKPFIVFHDAYQYFEAHYNLRAVGSITLTPDQPPGARRIKEIKDKLVNNGAVCLFSEQQIEPKIVTMLVDETHVRTGVLDPEGVALPPGRDLYFTLVRDLGRHLANCLAGRTS
jgi:zinc transport system substrate-binding protein